MKKPWSRKNWFCICSVHLICTQDICRNSHVVNFINLKDINSSNKFFVCVVCDGIVSGQKRWWTIIVSWIFPQPRFRCRGFLADFKTFHKIEKTEKIHEKENTVSSEVNMAEGGGIVEEKPAVWENNLQEQRDEVKQQQELISPDSMKS